MTIEGKSGQHEQRLELPLLPLKDIVVFPHMIVPVFINEDLCVNAVEEAMAGQRKIFLSAFKVQGTDGPGLECSMEAPFDVYDTGTICSVMRTRKLPDGRMKVLVQGLSKGRVQSLVSAERFPLVAVTPVQEHVHATPNAEIEAMTRAVRENLEKVVGLGKVMSPDIMMVLEDVSEPGRLADLVAANLGLKVHEGQAILAVNGPIERLKKVHAFLAREIEVYQMQVRIQSQAKEEIGKMQREHYLREQMRVIRNELGDGDGKEEIENFYKKLEALKVPDETRDEIGRQIKRLERMHGDSSEATITRTYLENVFALPWGKYTDDNLDVVRVQAVLDEDHYGLDQVKDRLIEFLSVKKLNPDAKSPILCFVGPPGVGKTSLGKSIARSMNRAFYRISLGGVKDEADVRGHRRTYVGAYPGRIIQGMRHAGSSNPVIMLDEIDKLASDHRGDPSSALLEVLDPEQNKSFVDHYLGVPFDLSRVTFIANANNIDMVPGPLRDRLEIIEVSGYTDEEKLAIANQYLIPKQMKETGLPSDMVAFNKSSLLTIINAYTRESGLRGLEKQIASVCRKIARGFAEKGGIADEDRGNVIKLTPTLVERHLGAKKYTDEFYHMEPTPGVSLGLAYTSYGGEVLAIETNLIPGGRGNLTLTGHLGDVMKESATAALSYIRSHADQFGVDLKVLKTHEIHIHLPAGAVPKDGPSAGIALATSMISALLKTAPAAKTAMTGEITLHGKVLPIGGVKEKLLGAHREGVTHVLLPKGNMGHFNALPATLKKRFTITFVSEYAEVFDVMFGRANERTNTTPIREHHQRTHRIAS